MNVREVIELTKEWVQVYGSQTPDFCGAHLMGSINTMSQDAPFPSYKDVDFALVLDIDERKPNQDLSYKGLILECASFSINQYRSPQVVLPDAELAPNLAVDSILSDPTGMLRELHEAVAKDYARHKWVLARCEYERASALEHLGAMGKAHSPGEISYHLGMVLNFLSGLMAIAYLRMPTHRRLLILMQELLERAGRPALYEQVLDVFGCTHMTRAQVASYLQVAAVAFDRAVEVHRTPFALGFKLHSYVRPYFVQATREMIDEGYHREAIAWIWAFHYLSNVAIQNDAPEGEKQPFQAGFDDLLGGLDLLAPERWPARQRQAQELVDEVLDIAEGVVERNPDIVD